MNAAARTALVISAFAVASLALADACAAAGSFDLDSAWTVARDGTSRLMAWIAKAYARQPALVIGLGGASALPVLVVLGAMLYRRPAYAPELSGDYAGPHVVCMLIDGEDAIELPPGRNLVQIGRHEDNDICLRDASVSRYHAILERSGDNGFTITDVSNPDGDGLRINGERCLRAVLSDGDMVELGNTRIRFASVAGQ